MAHQIDGDLISIPDPPDFVICRDGAAVGWVEVTTVVDGDRAAFAARLEKDGDIIEAAGLSCNWLVMLRTKAKIKNLDRDALVDLFRDYEAKLTETVGAVPLIDITYDREFWPTLDDFGVIAARPFDRDYEDTSIVCLFQKNPGGSSDANTITELAVNKAISKAQSLSGHDGERHLAILVNIDEPTGAGFALSNRELPEEVPTLPDEITDVWMSSERTLLWHFGRGADEWRIVDVEN